MRILGFTKKWPKLQQPVFSTFRYTRQDKNWFVGEEVQLVFHPRHKDHELMGIGKIESIEICRIIDIDVYPLAAPVVTDEEAIADGFTSVNEMISWMRKTYGKKFWPVLQKITVRRTDLGSNENQKMS